MSLGLHARLPAREAGLEFARYFSASLVALALDATVLQVAAIVVHYLLAATLGFIVGATTVYFLATRWVFSRRKLAERPRTEFSAFVSIGLVGLAFNDLVIFFAVDSAGASLLGGKLFAAGFSFVLIYTLRKLALF